VCRASLDSIRDGTELRLSTLTGIRETYTKHNGIFVFRICTQFERFGITTFPGTAISRNAHFQGDEVEVPNYAEGSFVTNQTFRV